VRAFDIAIGWCVDCGLRVQGRYPLQTSDAICAAAAQLGPAAVTLAVVLNKQLGLPSVLRTIQQRQLDADEIFAQLLRSPHPGPALAPVPVSQ
jgi:hypothetical protein